MYKAIREKARQVGADALIEAHYSEVRVYRDLIATAIVYTDRQPRDFQIIMF